MNSTDDRLAAIEQRLEQLEQLAAKAERLYERLRAGPGRKIAAMFGIELPP